MANIGTAELLVTRSGGDSIQFRVDYAATFNKDELGHPWTESFSLFERDTTSDNDVLARGLARAEFVPDVSSPLSVTRTLTATLREREVNTEIGNEEIFARITLSGPAGFAFFGDSMKTNEVEVAA